MPISDCFMRFCVTKFSFFESLMQISFRHRVVVVQLSVKKEKKNERERERCTAQNNTIMNIAERIFIFEMEHTKKERIWLTVYGRKKCDI